MGEAERVKDSKKISRIIIVEDYPLFYGIGYNCMVNVLLTLINPFIALTYLVATGVLLLKVPLRYWLYFQGMGALLLIASLLNVGYGLICFTALILVLCIMAKAYPYYRDELEKLENESGGDS